MENQLQLWMQRVNFPFQLTRHMAVIGNLHKIHHIGLCFFSSGNLTLGTELQSHLTEHQSHHMELQNLPMEHLLHPMDLQSPHTKPPNRPTKHPSHLMAHQLQCMHLHLPSTGARPMEPRQPQWCKLPMSGGREQEIILSLDKSVGKEICWRNSLIDFLIAEIREKRTSRPPSTPTLDPMSLVQQGKEGSMNATASLLLRYLIFRNSFVFVFPLRFLFVSSLFPLCFLLVSSLFPLFSQSHCSNPYLMFFQCPSNNIVGGVFKDYSALINPR